MKNQRLKRTAIKALLSAALLGFASVSGAQVVGTIAHLSGPLVAKKPNGTVKVLAVKSEVENGDTLVAEKNTYAQIKFVDNGEITLRPGTVFKIENYSYNADKPEADAEHLELIKGGLRSVTGLLGKRNKEKFALKTPSATIGIRGTTFVAQYVPPPKPTGDNMRIDYNASPMELGTQGKSPAAGTDQGKASPGSASASQPAVIGLSGQLSGPTPPTLTGSGGLGSVGTGVSGQVGGATPPTLTGSGGLGSVGTGVSGQLGGATPPTLTGNGGLGSVGTGVSGQLGGATPPTLTGNGGLGSVGTGVSGQLGGPTPPTLTGSGGLGSVGTGVSGQLGGPTPPTLTGSGGLGSAGTGLSGQLGGSTPTPPSGGGLGSVGLGQGGALSPPVLAPGLHLQVTDGAIVVTNNGGSLGFQAGQFGFVPSVNQPPVIVPSNPGIQFAPPPAFNTGSGGPTASNGPGKGQAVDCVVR